MKTRLIVYSLLLLLCLAAYANSFHGPFVFDDIVTIVENDSIRHLPGLVGIPPDTSTTGRPIANMTFAINFAVHGLQLPGYHVVNLVIHLVNVLLLFETLLLILSLTAKNLSVDRHLWVACSVALIWAVHPLNTESVTYFIGRTESLMGFFFIAGTYCYLKFLREHDLSYALGTLVLSVCGMLTKEVMVVFPIFIACLDWMIGEHRPQVSKGPYQRKLFFVLLFATCLIQVVIQLSWPRGTSVGINNPVGATPVDYFLSQGPIIFGYLRKTIIPTQLLFDYGPAFKVTLSDVLWPCLAGIGVLIWATRTISKRQVVAFCILMALLVLSPSSSFVPLFTQVGAERRMYLPLIFLLIPPLHFLASHKTRWNPVYAWSLTLVIGVVFTIQTHFRNEDYRTTDSLWRSVLDVTPTNTRAMTNLAIALEEKGRTSDAVFWLNKAVSSPSPFEAGAHYALGNIYLRRTAWGIAEKHYTKCVKLKPGHYQAWSNLGIALAEQNKMAAAEHAFKTAITLNPNFHAAQDNLKALKLPRGRH
ncbi:MAG: tetratricopeptide repeat protein [Verrucomicrobiota bacterium]|nr:tetratricopeptide repeat protein [Verrucomicrobiota bacterium]